MRGGGLQQYHRAIDGPCAPVSQSLDPSLASGTSTIVGGGAHGKASFTLFSTTSLKVCAFMAISLLLLALYSTENLHDAVKLRGRGGLKWRVPPPV
jgi:hypothetical protein